MSSLAQSRPLFRLWMHAAEADCRTGYEMNPVVR